MLCGIDAGGTKTEAVLFDVSGIVKKKIFLPAANPNDVGIDAACDILSQAVDLLSENIRLDAVFAGVAGAATGDNAEKICTALSKKYEFLIECAGDSANILALDGNTGDSMAVICGTGSAVFVRKNGETHIVGGWGQLFDEAGSAYDIGKDAIRQALAEYDGLVERSLLSDMLEKQIGQPVRAHLSEFYKQGKPYIASFAKLVFEAEAAGDACAKFIIEKSAKRVTELIRRAKEFYSYDGKIIASGGLFANEHYRNLISDSSENIVFPSVPQVYGACVGAMKMIGAGVDETFYMNFYESYFFENLKQ